MKLVSRVRIGILKYLKPFTIWFGGLHFPYTRKKITGRHYYLLRDLLEPGMVLLSKTDGEMSNLLIPGDWSHAAMYVGDQEIVEAIGKGVIDNDLVSFLMTKDHIAVMAPIYADPVVMGKAANEAKSLVGLPYDYEFRSNNKAFYCSEVIWWCYHVVMGEAQPFIFRDVWGLKTVTPDDIFSAKTIWECKWDSRDFQ